MPRYELTISGGEKILVDHPGEGMQEFLAELSAGDFLLLTEIRGSSTGAGQEVIVASRSISLVRSIEGGSRQSTTFRPKR